MSNLLKALVGSKLHGLDNEESDFDWKIITVSSLKDIISPFKNQKGKDTVSETEDTCSYELVHFAKLFQGCNPTVLEVLWSNHFPVKDPLANELIANRTKLLEPKKVFYSHRGYAKDQRNKMTLEGEFNDINLHRTPKAICAYIRIMNQGISLLETGDFNPKIPKGDYRDSLLDIKYNFNPDKHKPVVEALITSLELKLEQAFNDCLEKKILSTDQDISWLEDYLLRVYLKLGIT